MVVPKNMCLPELIQSRVWNGKDRKDKLLTGKIVLERVQVLMVNLKLRRCTPQRKDVLLDRKRRHQTAHHAPSGFSNSPQKNATASRKNLHGVRGSQIADTPSTGRAPSSKFPQLCKKQLREPYLNKYQYSCNINSQSTQFSLKTWFHVQFCLVAVLPR